DDASAPGEPDPLRVEAAAAVADRARRPAQHPAAEAALHAQLALAQALPEGQRVAVGIRQRLRRRGVAHGPRRSTRAEGGPGTEPGCEVLSATPAPSTWRAPASPRSCETASQTWLSPCT